MIVPYGLYYREPAWFKQNFDIYSSNNLNTNKLTIGNSNRVLSSDGIYYASLGFRPSEVYINSVDKISILKSDFMSLATLNFSSLPSADFYEISFDLMIPAPGVFKLSIDGNDVEVCNGVFPFKSIKPHLFFNNSNIKISFEGLDEYYDPYPYCGIDNIISYSYKQINCDITNYTPPHTTVTPKGFDILRGYKTFQTMQSYHTEISMSLVFYNAQEHTNFLTNCNTVVVFCDEKGFLYRGVLELNSVEKIGGVYIQQVKLLSSDNLGTGWY